MMWFTLSQQFKFGRFLRDGVIFSGLLCYSGLVCYGAPEAAVSSQASAATTTEVDVQYSPQFNFSNLHYFTLVPNPTLSAPLISQLTQSLEQVGFEQDQQFTDFFALLSTHLLSDGQELMQLAIYDPQQRLVWQGRMILSAPQTETAQQVGTKAVQTLVKFFPPFSRSMRQAVDADPS